ncbi:serine/threonine-protein phosphatase 7 long form homolog [Glycine soja]|uniref:serine/threonine-protein phosphatase 7 long form homolog n=1 Tax=Glycine soja TaxID=3848 RepID=UPI00103C152F|nr:serine/threonine-protein phosphatase 7 long form homolog [Glycine soja]
MHLEAFRDLAQAGGFSWGATTLVHLYDHLNEASQTPTRQMAGYMTLFQICEYFPMVHQCVVDDAYVEASPRASRWLTSKAHMTGIKGAPYRVRIEALTVTDAYWMPYAEHRGVKGFDLISFYTGQLIWGQIVVYVRPEWVLRQFGYIQTVPLPPVRDSLTGPDIDDRWLHFSDHLVPAGEICVVFDLPMHSVVDCQGCQVIVEDLELVINLKMVTEGTELYDIMARCLRIARGNAADGSLRSRQRRRIE